MENSRGLEGIFALPAAIAVRVGGITKSIKSNCDECERDRERETERQRDRESE
jgi:hypothetical protein